MDVGQLVSGLRATYEADRTRPRAWRAHQLTQLGKLLQEGRDALCEAMHQDLHKSPFEGFITEVMMIEEEVRHMLGHLDEMMAPEQVNTNMFNLPAWSSIQPEPLGVVLILGAW